MKRISVFSAAIVTLLMISIPWICWYGSYGQVSVSCLPHLQSHSWLGLLATSYQAGAIAAMVLGLGYALVFGGISYFKIAPFPVHFSLYGFVLALVAMVVVSLLTTPHSKEVLNKTMTGWYIHIVE